MDLVTQTTSLNYLGAQIKRIKNQEWSKSLLKTLETISEASSLSSTSYLKNFKLTSQNYIQIPNSTKKAITSTFF